VFKVCRSCGQEFQSWATECSDCGVPLQLSAGEALAPPEPDAPVVLEDLVLLRLGGTWELQALAEELQQRGISSRIDTPPDPSQARGSRAAAAQLAIYVPRAVAGVDDVEHDPNACPACGEPTPENAAECASCGLEFPEVPAE
jgi:hypothetical protein